MVRVLLVDDHPIIAGGLESMLENNSMELVGRISDFGDVRPALPRLKPNVIVSEARLKGSDILGNLATILQGTGAPAVVIFSAFDDLSHIARAAAIGIHEYVLKKSPLTELLAAIRAAALRSPPSADGLIAAARGRMRRPKQQVRDDVPLTRRELQVLQHIAMGLSNREIGSSLDISIETAKEHVQNILRKLDVNDRTQAAVWAVRKSLA
jgi:DNA-binding NarL/FixJ family response regulator